MAKGEFIVEGQEEGDFPHVNIEYRVESGNSLIN